jgi:predicted nucleic acid-binding protein
MSKLFLDTNIILDFLDKQRVDHEKAKQLFKNIIVNEYSVVISEDMLSTIYYIHKNKAIVLAFFETIIKEWHVVSYGEALTLEAIQLCQEHGTDLEDTLQCLCAKKHTCDFIVTSDKTFVNCGVEIVSYEALL